MIAAFLHNETLAHGLSLLCMWSDTSAHLTRRQKTRVVTFTASTVSDGLCLIFSTTPYAPRPRGAITSRSSAATSNVRPSMLMVVFESKSLLGLNQTAEIISMSEHTPSQMVLMFSFFQREKTASCCEGKEVNKDGKGKLSVILTQEWQGAA